jgi:hypothetical protein
MQVATPYVVPPEITSQRLIATVARWLQALKLDCRRKKLSVVGNCNSFASNTDEYLRTCPEVTRD